jgi:hypothetical protein
MSQFSGSPQRHVLDAGGERLVSFVELLKARCVSAGWKIARVILTNEVGRDGIRLARFLARCGIEVHVMLPSSPRWIGGRDGQRPT